MNKNESRDQILSVIQECHHDLKNHLTIALYATDRAASSKATSVASKEVEKIRDSLYKMTEKITAANEDIQRIIISDE